MIDKTSEENLKNSIDIVEIISNFIDIKKAGSNFKAKCPFHSEKTASFIISPQKQIYHCFGCLSPREEVRTVEGLKEIQEIKVGDEVFSLSGKITKVVRVLKHKPEYWMLKFKTDLFEDWSIFTANHDMMIFSKKNEKIETIFAQDVQRGDYFLYPVVKVRREKSNIPFNNLLEKGSYETTDRALIYDLIPLAIESKKIPSFSHDGKIYKINLENEESKKGFFKEINGTTYLLIRVKSIEKAPFEELVYDITVEDESHTFLTKSFLVGNCGVGGDAIEFVKEYEKLNYPEALEKIASIINFPLTYTKENNDYNEIRNTLEKIQKWYIKNLESNNVAKRYLQNRGIEQESIKKFGIGFVGMSHELMNFISSNFLSFDIAEKAGIIARDESGRFYARLIQRITFPIYSPSGVLVGFGGRTITNHPAKYINSPQTKLFNKSQLLYGYSQAKEDIYKNKKIILCEGYFDVIMLHQAGFRESVATLGTALTKGHLPLLRKGEPHIILAYDGDKAGINAGLKTATLLSQERFDGSVVLFPNGVDPADMIVKGQVEDIKSLLNNGQNIISFVIERLIKSYNLKVPKEKEKAFFEVKKFLNGLSPIIREEYKRDSATLLGISPSMFRLSSIKEPPFKGSPTTKEDTQLLSIIKTLYENDHLIDEVISILTPSMFGKYSSLFEFVVNNRGKGGNSNLTALLVDEDIKVMNKEELKKFLFAFLLRYYTKKLKNIIADDSLPLIKKSFFVRKIKMDIIPRLKKGELIKYNPPDYPIH